MTAVPDRPRRIGVFGGTFDPPHVGHVTVARDVADALELDEVLWVPAATSPFKVGQQATPSEVRLEMVRAAAEAEPRFQVWDGEIRRGGVSYMVDTLGELKAAHVHAELFLIIGADQVGAFDRWRRPEEILEFATLVVMDREGEDAGAALPDVPGIEDATRRVPVTRVDISGTRVRGEVARAGDWAGLVPAEVARVIGARGLYR